MNTVNEIRLAALSQRRALALSQSQLASQTGVSRKWLSEFERGKTAAELGLVLRLLNGLGLQIAVTLALPKIETEKSSKIAKKIAANSNKSTLVDLDKLLNQYTINSCLMQILFILNRLPLNLHQ